MLSRFSQVLLFVTLWSISRQAFLSMEFFRQKYWSELPCPSPEDLLYPGIEPMSLMSHALAGSFFTISTTWEALVMYQLPPRWGLVCGTEKKKEWLFPPVGAVLK